MIVDNSNLVSPATIDQESARPPGTVEGITTLDSEQVYCIRSFDRLDPFLISLVSDSDLWMYVSSRGGLTAGRQEPDRAVFAYETDDRLHQLQGVTGPITLIRLVDGDSVWEPFSDISPGSTIRRNLYKNFLSSRITFEEINDTLGLTFRYDWRNCGEFGFVRTAALINHSTSEVRHLRVLDGVLNVQPACVPLRLQQESSCLVDAYKRCEVDKDRKLAIYALNASITDRPEPAEVLHASIAWCVGLPDARVSLSTHAIRRFRAGRPLPVESELRGQRGNFLVASDIQLAPRKSLSWDIVIDTHVTQAQVASVRKRLQNVPRLQSDLREAVGKSTENLLHMIAAADGLQETADQRVSAHHQSCVLFNNLRGGVFLNGGRIVVDEFTAFVHTRHCLTASRHADALERLPADVTRTQLLEHLTRTGDPQLIRLGHEFLPLAFSRRHGDPSRPWNRFNIRVRDARGRFTHNYQGNWRDIFQNWEALCISFPECLGSVIAKFLSASTADGFNPYRISHEGVDWETSDPDDAWSHIGYWGDHQIVYLTRLLESCHRAYVGMLPSLLRNPIFSSADVPYRLRPFDQIVRDGKDTIDFDHAHAARIDQRVSRVGTDGRLLHDRNGEVALCNLAQKLLIPVLAKLGSFVPGGGIWLNTQRPEWNDANNALAGFGLSVVTTCHLRRHLNFLIELFRSAGNEPIALSAEVDDWLRETGTALQRYEKHLEANHEWTDEARMCLLAALGQAFSEYRGKLYQDGWSASRNVPPTDIIGTLTLALRLVDQTIRLNRRDDGLYHAYNLLKFSTDHRSAAVSRLNEMLEGQVAFLSSGAPTTTEAVELVESLFDSPLYRADQESFLLYPDRTCPGFLEKNVIPDTDAGKIASIRELLAHNDRRLIERDEDGRLRFAPDLINEDQLKLMLDQLEQDPQLAPGIRADRDAIVHLYEQVFRHHSFTGRSGRMFGYEGLGCIYWHMIGKLLVAIQEQFFAAVDRGEPQELIARLSDLYYRVRSGLGFNKTASEYGAFPSDPYSHTPSHGGARQPGMTGQVKEQIIARFGELGVRVTNCSLQFNPRLLEPGEFIVAPSSFTYINHKQQSQSLPLPAGSLAFTYCQTPVIYRIDESGPRIIVTRANRQLRVIPGATLDPEHTSKLFARDGDIERLELAIPSGWLRSGSNSLPSQWNIVEDPAARWSPGTNSA